MVDDIKRRGYKKQSNKQAAGLVRDNNSQSAENLKIIIFITYMNEFVCELILYYICKRVFVDTNAEYLFDTNYKD